MSIDSLIIDSVEHVNGPTSPVLVDGHLRVQDYDGRVHDLHSIPATFLFPNAGSMRYRGITDESMRSPVNVSFSSPSMHPVIRLSSGDNPPGQELSLALIQIDVLDLYKRNGMDGFRVHYSSEEDGSQTRSERLPVTSGMLRYCDDAATLSYLARPAHVLAIATYDTFLPQENDVRVQLSVPLFGGELFRLIDSIPDSYRERNRVPFSPETIEAYRHINKAEAAQLAAERTAVQALVLPGQERQARAAELSTRYGLQ